MAKNVLYHDVSDGCAYVGFCQSAVQIQTGRTSQRRPQSTVCLATEDCFDPTNLALSVYLIGARSPLHFEFDGKMNRKRFNDFICSHVDLMRPLEHFLPEDTMGHAAYLIASFNANPGDCSVKEINHELSMRMNQRIAQAAGEQLSARALLTTVAGSQTVGMALHLANEYGDSTIIQLTCDQSRLGCDVELVAFHVGEETADVSV